jgi:hypothetical protein
MMGLRKNPKLSSQSHQNNAQIKKRRWLLQFGTKMVHEQTKSLNIGLVNTPLMANGHFGNFISNLSYDYNNLWFKPLIWECDQTLVIFFSRPFQWWNGSSIWTKLGDRFVSKVPTFYVS